MRRRVVLVIFALLAACGDRPSVEPGGGTGPQDAGASAPIEADHDAGRLGARPNPAVSVDAPTGELPLPGPDEGILYVPSSYRPGTPAPLAISLHGCCGEAGSGLSLIKDYAEPYGMIVVAPQGSGGSWDVISGGFGSDVELIDAALTEVFATYAVDPKRVAIGGFSDGASYALSLGLTNGDLFTHVISHSPGFMAPGEPHGKPLIFVAHGREDRTLPFENAVDIVRELEEEGYRVIFRPFDAGHKRQPQIFRAAVEWFTGA